MRLFIAINFDEGIKDGLYNAIGVLKGYAKKGNFTRRENLHLTLVFIGETTKVDEVRHAMDKVHSAAFRLSIGGFGKFRRNGGDIYWVGVEKSSPLSDIQIQLSKELSDRGFQLESREFKPHLTLGREVLLNECFDKNNFEKTLPHTSMNVTKISLMKSERVEGKLTYTAIYEKSLDG